MGEGGLSQLSLCHYLAPSPRVTLPLSHAGVTDNYKMRGKFHFSRAPRVSRDCSKTRVQSFAMICGQQLSDRCVPPTLLYCVLMSDGWVNKLYFTFNSLN